LLESEIPEEKVVYYSSDVTIQIGIISVRCFFIRMELKKVWVGMGCEKRKEREDREDREELA
jgi:hypothetical protein